MSGWLDRLIPEPERIDIDHRTVDLVSGYVLGVITLSALVVVFGRGLTTGIVLLSVLLAALGLFVAALVG